VARCTRARERPFPPPRIFAVLAVCAALLPNVASGAPADARTSYSIAYDSTASADMTKLFQSINRNRPQQGTPPSVTSYALVAKLKGKLELTVVKADPAAIEAFYAIRHPIVRLAVNGQDQTGQAASVAQLFARGFLVDLTPEGQVVAIRLPIDADEFSRNFAQALLALIQFVRPAVPAGRTWTIEEQDRSGRYLARYKEVGRTGSLRSGTVKLRKTKIRYLPPAPDANPLPNHVVIAPTITPAGRIDASFDRSNGELVAMAGTEIETTTVLGKRVSRAKSTIRLTRIATSQLTPEEKADVARTVAALHQRSVSLSLFVPRSAREDEARFQRTELGRATVDDLLQRLAAANSGKGRQGDNETVLYLKLKALIFVHPESCTRLGKILAAANASSLTFRLLVGALGAVAHDQAQKALVAAIRTRTGDWPALSNLVPTLAHSPRPTADVEQMLRKLAASPNPDIASTALLGLGTMAGSLEKTDPARSNRIVDVIAHKLSASRSEQETTLALRALGNAGTQQATALAQRYAADTMVSIRAAALAALRFASDPASDTLLLQALATDNEPEVRLEAVYALGYHQPSKVSLAVHRKALQRDKDERVRVAVIGNLAKMRQQFPQVRAMLAQAAKTDRSENVRNAAAGALLQTGPVR
jgi:hypothetical protein